MYCHVVVDQRVNSRALPNRTRVLRKLAPERSPESSAKSLSRKFFGVLFLSLIIMWRSSVATSRTDDRHGEDFKGGVPRHERAAESEVGLIPEICNHSDPVPESFGRGVPPHTPPPLLLLGNSKKAMTVSCWHFPRDLEDNLRIREVILKRKKTGPSLYTPSPPPRVIT